MLTNGITMTETVITLELRRTFRAGWIRIKLVLTVTLTGLIKTDDV